MTNSNFALKNPEVYVNSGGYMTICGHSQDTDNTPIYIYASQAVGQTEWLVKANYLTYPYDSVAGYSDNLETAVRLVVHSLHRLFAGLPKETK